MSELASKEAESGTAAPKTTTVRISSELAAKVAVAYRKKPLSDLYTLLDPWVNKVSKQAVAVLMKGRLMPYCDCRRSGSSHIRLLTEHVRKLKVAGAILGRTVSDMVEERLWKVLTKSSQSPNQKHHQGSASGRSQAAPSHTS